MTLPLAAGLADPFCFPSLVIATAWPLPDRFVVRRAGLVGATGTSTSFVETPFRKTEIFAFLLRSKFHRDLYVDQ